MSSHHVPDAPEPSGDPKIDEVRADIAATRAELQDTVDALGAKLDVKAQAGRRVEAAKAKAPEPVQHGLDVAAPYRKQIALGVLGAVLAVIVVRRVRHR